MGLCSVFIVICPEQFGHDKVVGPVSSKSKKSSSSSFRKYFIPTTVPSAKIPATLPPIRRVLLLPSSSLPLPPVLALVVTNMNHVPLVLLPPSHGLMNF